MSPPACLDDLRLAARRRLPRFAFDFIDGGAAAEDALARNAAAFRRCVVRPRVLRGCVDRDLTTRLLGRDHTAPFGVAPIGLADLAWPGTDRALGRLGATGIPVVLSTAGTTSIEDMAAPAGGNLWFQLYVGQDHAIVLDLIDRAAAAGVDHLVVTVDVPSPGKRRRDLRNGFTLPLRPRLSLGLDLLRHPAWSIATARAGGPRFANLARYSSEGGSSTSLAKLMAGQSSARLDRLLLQELRARWKGKLLVKGVLHPDDARDIAALGADAIVVSNHGGRQFDGSVAPLAAIPAIRAAVGDTIPLILDGGVRTGEDILLAIAAGADFVLIGRPFVFSVAARGDRGPGEVATILRDELDRGLAQIGFRTIGDLRANRADLMIELAGAGGAA